MKKFFILTFLVLFMAGASFTQPDAIDFTAADINGNTQNLFSYLDDGKHVVIMFTMTG